MLLVSKVLFALYLIFFQPFPLLAKNVVYSVVYKVVYNFKSINMKDFLDLTEPLMLDTYLIVKFGQKFCHYALKREKKNGELRRYGDLWKYWPQQKDFRFAIGLGLGEEGEFWTGKNQHMYFDAKEPPHLIFKETQKFILLKRSKPYIPHYKPHYKLQK